MSLTVYHINVFKWVLNCWHKNWSFTININNYYYSTGKYLLLVIFTIEELTKQKLEFQSQKLMYYLQCLDKLCHVQLENVDHYWTHHWPYVKNERINLTNGIHIYLHPKHEREETKSSEKRKKQVKTFD